MEKKYELTNETREFGETKVIRIRALRDFGNVHAGDLGGWIQTEANLSHGGNAHVDGNACVDGNARVDGNVRVGGNARVGSNALIKSIDDILCIDMIGSRNGATTFFKTKTGGIWVDCGCFLGSLQ